MNIILTDTQSGIIAYSAYNYKQNKVFVVCYGLEIKKFTTIEDMYKNIKNCIDHANLIDEDYE